MPPRIRYSLGESAISSAKPEFIFEDQGWHMGHGDNRKSCSDPARSETLRISGSDLQGRYEFPQCPEQPNRAEQVKQ